MSLYVRDDIFLRYCAKKSPACSECPESARSYHRRSRVETKMHCMKLLGQRLMARDFDRQIAEVQIRIAVMNGYTALGIPVTTIG